MAKPNFDGLLNGVIRINGQIYPDATVTVTPKGSQIFLDVDVPSFKPIDADPTRHMRFKPRLGLSQREFDREFMGEPSIFAESSPIKNSIGAAQTLIEEEVRRRITAEALLEEAELTELLRILLAIAEKQPAIDWQRYAELQVKYNLSYQKR